MLILDEAHHAAPASGSRYAISSQFTKAVSDIAGRFEHRLFLSATPHNGHPNSFSTLLEMLDPQRFTRGVSVRPAQLEPVMVRRLKADLRLLQPGAFPERVVQPIALDGLAADTPELPPCDSPGRVRRAARTADRPASGSGASAGPPGVLGPAAAPAVVRRRVREDARGAQARAGAHRLLRARNRPPNGSPGWLPKPRTPRRCWRTRRGPKRWRPKRSVSRSSPAPSASRKATSSGQERAAVEAMLAIAKRHAGQPDERAKWIIDWCARALPGRRGVERAPVADLHRIRGIPGRWLQRQLLNGLEDADTRRGTAGHLYRRDGGRRAREAVKRAFNADPKVERLRILLCTDAAREGVNLQMHCADLIHFDLPWNPARLEQRNGRIDRKLQPSPQVRCCYFLYPQRPEDVVLGALVRKTETIRSELGAIGQVLEERIARRLASHGISRADVAELARQVQAEDDSERLAVVQEEMGADAHRLEQLRDEEQRMRRQLERSRERVGVDPNELRKVVSVAMGRAGVDLEGAKATSDATADAFRIQPGGALADESWAKRFRRLARPSPRSPRAAEGLPQVQHPGARRAHLAELPRRVQRQQRHLGRRRPDPVAGVPGRPDPGGTSAPPAPSRTRPTTITRRRCSQRSRTWRTRSPATRPTSAAS